MVSHGNSTTSYKRVHSVSHASRSQTIGTGIAMYASKVPGASATTVSSKAGIARIHYCPSRTSTPSIGWTTTLHRLLSSACLIYDKTAMCHFQSTHLAIFAIYRYLQAVLGIIVINAIKGTTTCVTTATGASRRKARSAKLTVPMVGEDASRDIEWP